MILGGKLDTVRDYDDFVDFYKWVFWMIYFKFY